MHRIILVWLFLALSGNSFAQDQQARGFTEITSITGQGRELIVGNEIYLVPDTVKFNGLEVSRSRVASLLQPGDKVMVEVESGRTVRAIYSRHR